jgi:ubiquilin
MADTAGAEDATVTFHVKSSGGQKYTLSLPLSTTTIDLKNKLAGEEYANVPASAQRLIYSGKVLKDHETLASHNVKEGNTMHLVKSAASNQRQNPAAQSSSPASASPGTPTPAAGVPQNLASGTGNDPLAGLTGARYAGFAQLPNASMFQNAQNPEDFIRQLEDPNFQQVM